MGARGKQPSILRQAMKNLLLQHKAAGIEFSEIERRFGSIDRCRLHQTLKNLRQCAEAYCERAKGNHTGLWFPASPSPDHLSSVVSPADWKRQQRARQADQTSPIVFYGDHLRGGRCASVWEYARHHQEQRA